MGCKGKKRREKNYRKAHGAFNKLPPPPDPAKLDALPSKLRQIIAFASNNNATETPPKDSAKGSKNEAEKRVRKEDGGSSEKKLLKKKEMKDEDRNEQLVTTHNIDSGEEYVSSSKSEKRNKKRKRKQVEDLRFEADLGNLGGRSKKKERKKKLLQERKKKHKRNKAEENVDFPGCEQIKFGDVVQAPPKLVTVPKAPKNIQDASRERLRLQAIESYRNRRGWTSRPGIKLPPPVTSAPL